VDLPKFFLCISRPLPDKSKLKFDSLLKLLPWTKSFE